MSILNEELKKEIKGKLKEGQFGFRTAKETIDTIDVMSHMVNQGIKKKGRRIFVFFANLKAFDRVDREKLEKERLKEIGVKEKLKKRIMETYRETKNKIKIGNRESSEF